MLQLVCNQVMNMRVKSYCKGLKLFQRLQVRQMQLLRAKEKLKKEKRKVFDARCHHGKLCTQKQLASVTISNSHKLDHGDCIYLYWGSLV